MQTQVAAVFKYAASFCLTIRLNSLTNRTHYTAVAARYRAGATHAQSRHHASKCTRGGGTP